MRLQGSRGEDVGPVRREGSACRRKHGRLDDALADYQAAIRLAPKRADLRVRHAGLLLKRGRLDESLAELKVALTLQPNDPRLQQLADWLQKRAKAR